MLTLACSFIIVGLLYVSLQSARTVRHQFQLYSLSCTDIAIDKPTSPG